MKRCPQCRRDYFDETLAYCLDDGSHLVDGPASDEPVTAIQKEIPAEAPTRHYPKGEEREHQASRRSSLIAGVIGIVIVTALGVGSYWYYGRGDGNPIDSIAVMPFENQSGSPEFEYLSDGMTDTLIAGLMQIPNLNVKARSSVYRYKGKDIKIQDVGRELGVDAILNGRVVQRGQELTVYLELVDAKTENSLWQQTYNRVTSNLIALQSEIARDVAEKLRVQLSGAEQKQLTKNYTENAEAYRLYLLGRYHWNKRTKADLDKAKSYYEQAVAVDPNYARAFAGLADVYIIQLGYDQSASPAESQAKSREFADKAVALDGSLSEGRVSLGVALHTLDFNFTGAEREFKQAIVLDPSNANAHAQYAFFLTGPGRFAEAEPSYKRALELEPATITTNRNFGGFLFVTRRYEESLAQMKKTVELDPASQLSHFSLANALLLLGRYAEAVEAYARSREIAGRPDQAAAMRSSFQRGGWRGFVLDYQKSGWSPEFRVNYVAASRLASIGETEKALDALEQAVAEREGFVPLINVDPRLDPLRDEPRFKELLRKVGL